VQGQGNLHLQTPKFPQVVMAVPWLLAKQDAVQLDLQVHVVEQVA
jgi:hypothetical protein